MFDYREFKLRVSPWLCFFLGGILLLCAILDTKGTVSWYDLYPGASAIAAGLLLLGFLRYMDRKAKEEVSDSDLTSADSYTEHQGRE